ncbi:helix-turn-helix domain-containing protein [Paenibacillus tepidiphilus]|uniref:helix-turn-helix domain-containing protein n=1 Tax=Paenibacillus tepidiphilus TaxID=2608683 RepID=UPI00123B1F97|nr:helix-turn-helix transcriptional regulator [Paenibacillus tepidiphilus]
MNTESTILTEIEEYMKRESLSISKFAERCGLHSGTLSNIINSNRPIAMQQLDRITEAMGLDTGFYYDLYIDNYIVNGSANWRRIGPLLLRCAELQKLEALERVVGTILDNLVYLPLLFDTAEELFTKNMYAAAAIIYKSVAEAERLQHSERLALCRYRLFHIAIGDSQAANLHAANQFEPYIERLEEADQLDAIKTLTDVFSSLRLWDKVEAWAMLLVRKAKAQYQYFQSHSVGEKQPSRPLVYYVLYGYLMQAAVSDEREDYEQALGYTRMYSNVQWVKPPLSEGEAKVIAQFEDWALANTYLYRMMSGDIEVIPDYVAYLQQQEHEIFPALYKIMQAANRFHFDVDPILELFRDHLTYREQHSTLGKFTESLTKDRFARFQSELAIYYLRKAEWNAGFHYLLESLTSSIRIMSDTNITLGIGLFEKYRMYALPEHIERYHHCINKELNEQKYKDLLYCLLPQDSIS